MADERPMGRRNFFRRGLGELLRPLAGKAGPLHEVIKQIGELDQEAAAAEKVAAAKTVPPSIGNLMQGWVRPPGALPEQQFRDTCNRCGDCVKVCPVQCITIDPTGLKGAGAPRIEIDQAACVLCDGLLCTRSCPTGAIQPIAVGDIDMGTAEWRPDTCLRTGGEDCTICVDQCPVGEMAIRLDGGKVAIVVDGCTGCGVCQNRCPTSPKSIVVKPRMFQTAIPVGRPRS